MASEPQKAPEVTVLLAVRDRPALLAEAVASALAQAGAALEVLVVDDGSGRETQEWLAAAAAREPLLRAVRQDSLGVGAARRRGVEEARGEIIVILDSDDLLTPGAVERLASFLRREPAVDLVYADVLELHEDGRRRLRRYPRFASPARFVWATFLLPRVPFKHSGSAFRRERALTFGNYDASLPLKVDVDLFLRFARRSAGVRHLPGAPTAVFRIHAGSISRDRRLGREVWRELARRYGPRQRPVRALLCTVRLLWEHLKAVVEEGRWR